MAGGVLGDIAKRAADECGALYGPRLVGVVVFGSVALQTARPDSDIDLLVVVEPLPDGRVARVDEFKAVTDRVAPALDEARVLGITTRLAPIIRTPDELASSGYLIFDIAFDGVILSDREGRLERYLAGIRERLERRGAERRWFDGKPYWVLEPGVRPGQVVEL